MAERQLTRGPGGRILTNTGVWSPAGDWIVYDVRSDAKGDLFDGGRIEAVHAETGAVRTLYTARDGAHCGVATFHPSLAQVVFIHGPERPTPDWSYGPSHRQGVTVDLERPGIASPLDARDLTPPFTPGALRGGSHVHVWSPRGDLLSFTYNDALPGLGDPRAVGVCFPRPVTVSRDHPRNHDGACFSVLVTAVVADPVPGSDQIRRAFEEGWIGRRRALAFLGETIGADGAPVVEVFVATLPSDLTRPGDGPVCGTEGARPFPPRGVRQRRLTVTGGRAFPGVCTSPRHWLRASPDGKRIAFLLRDDDGLAQLFTISPAGGPPRQVTRGPHAVESAFTWSPDGRRIAHVRDHRVCVTDVASGKTVPLTDRATGDDAPSPLACVFSPDGAKIAFLRRPGGVNQICVVDAQTA